jgi:hypothetical protein
MRAFLVRVAIDSTYGHWNGPVDPQTGRFVYMPIPEAMHPLTGQIARLCSRQGMSH